MAAGRASSSPLAEALASVGDRWTLLIVDALLDGPRRFGDLQRELPGIAPNILTQRLRNLEAQGLVVAQPLLGAPAALRLRADRVRPRAGRRAAPAVRLGRAARATTWSRARHSACGTPLEVRWYCPTCDQAVDEDAAEGLHYA